MADIEYKAFPHGDRWVLQVRDIGRTVWSVVDAGWSSQQAVDQYAEDKGYVPAEDYEPEGARA